MTWIKLYFMTKKRKKAQIKVKCPRFYVARGKSIKHVKYFAVLSPVDLSLSLNSFLDLDSLFCRRETNQSGERGSRDIVITGSALRGELPSWGSEKSLRART